MRYPLRHPSPRPSWQLRRLALAAVLGVSTLGLVPTVAEAGQDTHGEPTVQINAGGGVALDGADGLRFVMNSNGDVPDAGWSGQDQLYFRNTFQYCCSASAPMLNIGGTLYGEAGPAYSSTSWTDLEVVEVTGSGTTAGGSATGSGSATIRYSVTHGGLDYVIVRTVTYTHPNSFLTDAYEFVLPVGNTETVKFYLGGDTAPGSSDSGTGVMLTSPVRTVYSVNPSSAIQIGFGEVPGDEPFDGATAQSFGTPYATVGAGGDIGFVATAGVHDAGLMIQWNLGNGSGTLTRSLRHYVGARGAALTAGFLASESEPGEEVVLALEVVNTGSTDATGLAATFALPAGLTITSSATSNTCGGTLTAPAAGATVVLSAGTVVAAGNCLISVPVKAAAAGDYTITSALATGVAGMENGVGTSTLTVSTSGTPTSPTPTNACADDIGRRSPSDQVARLYRAVLGREADTAGHLFWTRGRLTGMTAPQLAERLLASPERTLRMGGVDDNGFVEGLYLDVLGRPSDTPGLEFWLGRLEGGLSRVAVVLMFSESTENVARTATSTPIDDATALVCRLYTTALHRMPEAGGLAHWTGLLTQGTPPARVAALVMGTPEAAAVTVLSTEAFVGHLYQGAFGRIPEPAGSIYWSNLTSVVGRPTVALWLANSIETL